MKTKRFYTVTYKELTNSVSANSPYHAAKLCFKQWIRKKLMKRQPKSDDAGGFEGVEVEIL